MRAIVATLAVTMLAACGQGAPQTAAVSSSADVKTTEIVDFVSEVGPDAAAENQVTPDAAAETASAPDAGVADLDTAVADALSDLDAPAADLADVAPDQPAAAEIAPDVQLPDVPAEPDAPVEVADTGADAAAPETTPVVDAEPDAAPEDVAETAADAGPDSAPDSAPDAASAPDSAPDAALDTAPPPCTTAADCAPLEDGDPCNGTLYCETTTGQCAVNPATVVQCPTDLDTTCAKAACVPATGKCALTPVKDGTVCNDGNKCTAGDVCVKGLCDPGEDICLCKSTADCAAQEDGNFCNGTLFCNKATGKCQINPATVISCPTVDDTVCLKNACQPKTGKCQLSAAPETTPCDDGNPCTPNEACAGGQCVATANVCECAKDADCIAKDDGNLCNGLLYCDLKVLPHVCVMNPATIVTCPTVDDSACIKTACAPKTGKCVAVDLPDGATCDADGSDCTQGDQCQKGVCTASVSVCQCQTDSDCAPYQDADACNGTLYCNQVSHTCLVNPATIVQCPFGQDTACVQNQCDPVTGKCSMTAINNNGPCDSDGNACTPYDICIGGKCQTGANVCGCQKDADCAAQEDGDLCNGTLFCDQKSNSCAINPATVVVCPDDGKLPCARNTCSPSTGKCAIAAANEGKWCDGDNNPCTLNDTCVAGACVIGKNICACELDGHCDGKDDASLCNGTLYCNKSAPPFVCEVAKATIAVCSAANDTQCLKNQCQPLTGKCLPTPVLAGTACDDGSPCSLADQCKLGICAGAAKDCNDSDPCTADSCLAKSGVCAHAVASCDDGNSCTTDACDAKLGCVNAATATATPCDDGNLCTQPDVCAGGTCKGAVLACDDGKPCTADSCNAQTGCVNSAIANGQPCSDGDKCTTGDACAATVCKGTAIDCDDGEPCTADSCVATSGNCVNAGTAKACNDNNPCTGNDTCATGKCKGSPANCDDGKPCTTDGCDPKTGCKVIGSTAAGTGCDDGNACTASDQCDGNGACKGSAKVCDDGLLCTTDSCNNQTGCVFAANSNACDDGNACTKADTCQPDTSCKGTASTCDDGNPCTDDACDPKKGCTATNNTKPCVHANQCLANTTCSDGVCQNGTTVVCDDGVACTVDTCDAQKGCVFTPKDALCDDADPCTGEVCDKVKGCSNPALPDTTPCATNRFCSGGQCIWAKQVDVGAAYACALRADGTVWCWGAGYTGELGNGKSGNANGQPVFVSTPSQVLGLQGAVKISANNNAVCALMADNTAQCWGNNSSYQTLGTVSGASILDTPSPVKNLTQIADIVAGSNVHCAVMKTGDLYCSGDNQYGEFGLGGLTPSFVIPHGKTGYSGVTQAVQGDSFVCALSSGKVACSGWNTFGQMGNGKSTPAETPTVTPVAIAETVQLAAGSKHVCALLKDGTVNCWGNCSYGQLGGTKACPVNEVQPTPDPVVGLGDVKQIDAQGFNTCAVKSDGSVWCWGRGINAQIGDGGAVDQYVPRQVAGLPACVSVATGDMVSCARDAMGQVFCWGNGINGALGDGAGDIEHVQGFPALVPASAAVPAALCKNSKCSDGNPCTKDGCDANGACTHTNVADGTACGTAGQCHQGTCKWASDVAVGDNHACALRPNGDAYCWGRNLNGQLGNGTVGGVLAAAVKVKGAANGVQIAAGGNSTCMVQAGGAVQCWGAGDQCQLAGSQSDQPQAVLVPGLSDVGLVAVGTSHACALQKASGDVYCWGSNSSGEVGNNAPGATPVCTPKLASGAKPGPVKAGHLALGNQFSVGIGDIGYGYFWGKNDKKQLTSLWSQAFLPQPNSQSMTALKWVTAGKEFACLLAADGTPKCWGDNAQGQGSGSAGGIIGSPTPVPNAGLFTALAAGSQHACGITANGTVRCWGLGSSGQLGQGSGAATGVVDVAGLIGAEKIAAGGDHTCAVDAAGQVFCWGGGVYGELGAGQSGPGTQSAKPVMVTASAASSKDSLCKIAGLCDDNNPCTQDICNLADGSCSHPPVGDGAPCGANGSGNLCASGACKTPFATDVAVGWGFTCVRRPGGAINCVGQNSNGEVGAGLPNSSYKTWVPVTGFASNSVVLAAQESAACSVRNDGKVFCWGSNANAVIGSGASNVPSYSSPVEVTGLTGKVGVAVGYQTACAWSAAGAVHCWGRNDYGQVGNGNVNTNPPYQLTPVPVSIVSNVTQMAISTYQTCARTSGSALYCWGYNNGVLGTPAPNNSPLPTPQLVAASPPILGLGATTNVTYTLDNTGDLHGFVVGNYSLSGYFSNVPAKSAPVPRLPVIAKVEQFSAATGSLCAVLTDGRVACLGENYYGQTQPFPKSLNFTKAAILYGMTSVAKLACGHEHCCAVHKDGSVGCWGLNWYGEFGNGTSSTSVGIVPNVPGTAPQ